jgi:isoquinoline 1-oxidoreductase beta subunit
MSAPKIAAQPNRREFLKTGAAGGAALLIGFHLPMLHAQQAQERPLLNPINTWLKIDKSGEVTLSVAKSEMGQGVYGSLAMILADELELDWKKVRIEHSPTDPKRYDTGTGGSGSVSDSWLPLRQAGASAREMFITAAAQNWSVDRDTCRAANGAVLHGHPVRQLTYGELVEAAATLPIPDPKKVPLKNPSDFKLIGTSVPRPEIPSKVNGSAKFGIDVRVPGMLFAVVARCPTFGGKPAKFDSAKALAVLGVKHVVEIPAVVQGAFTAGGIAVVADSSWAAMQGRKALEIEWGRGPAAAENSEDLRRQFMELVEKPGKVVVDRGDAPGALTKSAKTIEAVYEVPFLAHATMEPMNCTADVREKDAEVWAPTQGPDWNRDMVAMVAGIPPESVTVHTMLSGGAFGRRYQTDFAVEAAQVSKAVKKPVQVLWTREDDMQHDFYRQAAYQKIRAALDDRGMPVAWHHRLVSTSIRVFWDAPERAIPERQEMGQLSQFPYAIPNLRIEYAYPKCSVPRAWWRSVENSISGFVLEGFLDELAAAAKIDPIEYRLRLLASPEQVKNSAWPNAGALNRERLKNLIKFTAEKANWGHPAAKGRGRGFACSYSFDTYVAQVAEVSVAKDGAVRVYRIVCGVDCGRAVNPDGVKAQAEGAIIYGLSAVLFGEITIQDGAVQQSNFHDYPVARITDAPVIEVHIMPSLENPTGMGEPCLPPVASAVCNAIFAAKGKRVRRLPIRTEDLV